jgi:hypothetical protein
MNNESEQSVAERIEQAKKDFAEKMRRLLDEHTSDSDGKPPHPDDRIGY